MNEKQQINTLRNVLTDIHQQGLTSATALRDADVALYDRLWIAMYDFSYLALSTRSHVNRSGKRGPGNATLLAAVHMVPDDVASAVLVHLISKLDRILNMPVGDVIPFLHTSVNNYCKDLVRRKKPDPVEMDQPIGDGAATFGDMLSDDRSDFLANMVEEALHAEQMAAARDVVLRLFALMKDKPGVASALLSRLMGVKPREMASSMRTDGVARTVCGYLSALCRTAEISGDEASAALPAQPDWDKTALQLHAESSSAECAMQISRLCHRHRRLLIPDSAA